MNHKFYLAAPSSMKEELKKYKKELEDFGHEVVSRWIDSNDPEKTDKDCLEAAAKDVEDLDNCNWFILFTSDKPSGSWVEFGIVLGLTEKDIRISIIGEVKNIFCYLVDRHNCYPTWQNFIYRNFWK